MSMKYAPRIPRKPVFRRKTYVIPSQYAQAYSREGVQDTDKQMILYHMSQFGGFRIKKIPDNMDLGNDFLERWCNIKGDGPYIGFKPSEQFLLTFGGLPIKPLERIWRQDPVCTRDMVEEGFTSEEISNASRFLRDLNQFYEDSVYLDMVDTPTGISIEDRIHLSKFHGNPFLVKRPRAGGRFFHPESSYQRISSTLRRFLFVNGEPTSEIDLSAAVMQFLGVSVGSRFWRGEEDTSLGNKSYEESSKQYSLFPDVEAPEEELPVDPYQYFLERLNEEETLRRFTEEGPLDRENLKQIVYTALFSRREREESSVNRKLQLMGRNIRHADLSNLFQEFFEALKILKGNGLPPHQTIFREESAYAQEVLEQGCLEERLPILPIHDSFITPCSNTSRLGEIMDEVSKRRYGYRLVHKLKGGTS